MNNQKNDIESIREYIRAHEEYFSSPEGLGWKRPGGLPEYYAARPGGVVPGPGQGRTAEAGAAGEGEGRGGQRPHGVGRMSQEARCLLDSIRSLAGQGHPPKEIASRLGIVGWACATCGHGTAAYDPEAQTPISLPELETFRRTFGRSW